MYCSHCGYDLSEKEMKSVTLLNKTKKASTEDVFVCPRCGAIIKNGLDGEEVKALSRASHAEVHRGNNSINTGMCFLVLGVILGCVAFMFFMMSFKASQGNKLIVTSTEFYVFCGLAAITISFLTVSIVSLVRGIKKKKKYTNLIKEIQNEVFYQ